MESFWARLQVELLNTRRWATTIELVAAMADYIDNFHNVERRHAYLGNISPTEIRADLLTRQPVLTVTGDPQDISTELSGGTGPTLAGKPAQMSPTPAGDPPHDW